MIKKEELEQLENIYKEQKDLQERIDKLESKPQEIVTDSVKGSSKTFPYTQHNCIVTGLEEDISYKRRKNRIKKLKKIYKNNEEKIQTKIIHIEYELNKIEDSEIRLLIRYKYEDNLTYIQTAHKMNDLSPENTYTADSIRMTLKRFFEENK